MVRSTPAPLPVVPFARCSTLAGVLRKPSGRPRRYRGEPFGITGMLCMSCRNSLAYRMKATVRAMQQVPKNERFDPTPREIAAMAERKQALHEEWRRNGRLPATPADHAECEQRRWSGLAASERRRVVETRRHAVRRPRRDTHPGIRHEPRTFVSVSGRAGSI
jgi:hypothetical protein